MKLKTFDTFQPSVETYAKKVGLVGENEMRDLFGDRTSDVVIKISPNAFSTYQVFSRLPGANFIPKYVSNRLHATRLKTPVTVISPLSEIRTYSTYRKLRSDELLKNSIYFHTPKVLEQFQITAHEGKIIGLRQIIDRQPVHIKSDRFPKTAKFQEISDSLYEALKTDLMRFRVGMTKSGPVLLAMENFKLQAPEMAKLYVNVYENFVGHMPEWFKHHIESSTVMPFLSEYINREEMSKKCPYLL